MPATPPALVQPARVSATALQPYVEAALAHEAAGHEPPAQKAGAGKAPYLAALGGEAFDGVTTLDALSRGAHERNPALTHGGTAGLFAVKAGGTAGLMLLMRRLDKSGHPTAAKWLGYLAGGATLLAGLHNLTVAR